METKWNETDQNNHKHILGQTDIWYKGCIFTVRFSQPRLLKVNLAHNKVWIKIIIWSLEYLISVLQWWVNCVQLILLVHFKNPSDPGSQSVMKSYIWNFRHFLVQRTENVGQSFHPVAEGYSETGTPAIHTGNYSLQPRVSWMRVAGH